MKQSNKQCIFEDRECSFAQNGGGVFECTSPDDNSMPCKTVSPPGPRQSPYARAKARVYSTGNKWAIENFNATH